MVHSRNNRGAIEEHYTSGWKPVKRSGERCIRATRNVNRTCPQWEAISFSAECTAKVADGYIRPALSNRLKDRGFGIILRKNMRCPSVARAIIRRT